VVKQKLGSAGSTCFNCKFQTIQSVKLEYSKLQINYLVAQENQVSKTYLYCWYEDTAYYTQI
jgi:hypothetical protein